MAATLPRAVGAPARAHRGAARRSRAQARYAFEHPMRGRRLRRGSCSPRSPAAASRASTRAAALALARRARRALRTSNAPRARAHGDDAELLGPAVARRRLPRPDRRGRASPTALEAAREARRGSCASTTTRSPTTSCCAPTTRGSTRPRRSTRASRPTTEQGDVEAALAGRPRRRRRDLHDARRSTTTRWSRTPRSRVWERRRADALRLDAGRRRRARQLAKLFGLEPEQVRVIAEHVGGGFGSKGTPRPHVVLAALAAKLVGRPVKLAVTRQQMFALVRLPHADDPAHAARRRPRTAGSPRSPTTSSEQTLDGRASSPSRPRLPTRMMYAAPNRATTHRLARARRADAVVDARARRVPGHVRARVGDGRAGDRAAGSTRSSCAIRNEPERRPRERQARSARATSSPACARAPSASAGRAATRRPACAATGAGWSAPASPRRPTRPTGSPSQARARVDRATARSGADRGRRHRHRRAHRAHPDRRRRARRRRSSGSAWRSATAPSRARAAGRRLDGHRPRGARPCTPAALRAQLRGDGDAGDGGLRTTRAERPRRARAARPPRVRRPVRRGARRRRHRRGARRRACSACSPPGASSTRAPRARSSSAA